MQSNNNQHFLVDLLFPKYFRWIGGVLAFLGALLTYLRFILHFDPKILECKVFAIYSAYFKTRYFAVIENNITEELCGVLLLSGLFLIAFSKGKIEKPAYMEIRFRALAWSIIASTVIVLLSFIFIYGTGFIGVLVLNIFLPLIIYNVLFFVLLYRFESKQKSVLK